jgi:hypothetical protein
VKISYDPQKRARTLAERGLDFDDAVRLFACSPVRQSISSMIGTITVRRAGSVSATSGNAWSPWCGLEEATPGM